MSGASRNLQPIIKRIEIIPKENKQREKKNTQEICLSDSVKAIYFMGDSISPFHCIKKSTLQKDPNWITRTSLQS
jgi:hypothetical protein